jgi:hypothetical protein
MRLKLLVSLQILAFSLLSQTTPPLSYLSNTDGGSTYEVCYYNNNLYAGCANTLKIFDLTGPNHTPNNLLRKIRFISNIDYITVHNGFLYICANHDGLYKYNISSPSNPTLIAHYAPKKSDESIYDIAFYGDSVFVAAKTKVNLLLDSNNTFTYRSTVATYTAAAQRVRGLDIKDSLLAYTVAYGNPNTQTGVYLRNVKNNQLLNFYHDTIGNPVEVSFGQNTKLLNVMGGTFQPLFSVNGRFYALDYTNPNLMQLKFTDTITGFAAVGAFSCPMNATIINDTVYVSTQGGTIPGYNLSTPLTGEVYVYDTHNSNSISLLTTIYGGLYHFDTDIDVATRTMYVASEWYGVLTVDINNIYNEISRGKTLTGGWCHGSAQAKDRLAEASEGYGVRLFSTTYMQTPTLIKEDTSSGFCRAISLSDSADYVYAWFLTGKRFRVQDGNNLNHIAGINVDPSVALPADYLKSRHFGNKVAVIQDPGLGQRKIIIADVTNPAAPFIQSLYQRDKANDLVFHPGTGDLIACSEDSVLVFDSNTGARLSGVKYVFPGQTFKSFTLSNDTLYVNYIGIGAGISRYAYSQTNHTLTYMTANLFPMNSTYRTFMAHDNSFLYIGSSIDSLRAIKKSDLSIVAKYNHGADFINDNLWGNTDMYYHNGYLFLNEYMGQTTIFGPPTPTSGIQNIAAKQLNGSVYPNPANEYITIKTGTVNESIIKIYDVTGKIIYSADVKGEKMKIDISFLQPGFYFASILVNGEKTTSKFIVEK